MEEKILVYMYRYMHRVICPDVLYTHHMYPYILKESKSDSVGSELETLL